MTYTPTIYDWRESIEPVGELFVTGGQSIPGGMTLGGFLNESPEPGGRGQLLMSFNTMGSTQASRDAVWTMSRIAGGALMRIKVRNSIQLVPTASLNAPLTDGIPWATGEPWATDENWLWSPWVAVTDPAAKGQTQFAVDMSGLGEVLDIGHVVGFESRFTHIVMEVTYDASDVATVTVDPPLRRAVAVDDQMQFRPTFVGQCANPGDVAKMIRNGLFVQPGAARFVEALI